MKNLIETALSVLSEKAIPKKVIGDETYNNIAELLKDNIYGISATKKALINHKKLPYTMKADVHPADVDQADDALQTAFPWDKSPEGHDYWLTVYDDL